MSRIPYSCPSIDDAISYMEDAKNSLETTRSINSDLRARVDELETDLKTAEIENDKLSDQVDALKEEIKSLQLQLTVKELT